MEAARPVHHIVIEPMQAVAGDNKEFFPLRCAVKQAQKCGLWIGIMIATKGFVKLVKQEYNLLNKNIEALSVLIQSWSNSYAQKALLYFYSVTFSHALLINLPSSRPRSIPGFCKINQQFA